MAVDTRDKRASAVGILLPWHHMLPLADTTIDQGDRQQTAWSYRGILAAALPVLFSRRNGAMSVMLTLASGDKVRIRFERTSGADTLKTIADASRMKIRGPL